METLSSPAMSAYKAVFLFVPGLQDSTRRIKQIVDPDGALDDTSGGPGGRHKIWT